MPAHSTRLPMLGLQQLASVQARAHRANTMSEHIFNVLMLSQFLISKTSSLAKGQQLQYTVHFFNCLQKRESAVWYKAVFVRACDLHPNTTLVREWIGRRGRRPSWLDTLLEETSGCAFCIFADLLGRDEPECGALRNAVEVAH